MKNTFLVLFFTIFIGQTVFAQENQVDPFSKIENIKFANGLEVFLAPSEQATNMAFRLDVLVGYEVEKEQDRGISHLLEHVLFRDKQLKEEMTYLQVIREAGGEANGSTNSRVTSYFGSIPYSKSEWLLQSVSKMILEPTFADDYVEKEKGTVELERGRPGPITMMLGFNPMDYVKPAYLSEKGFWEQEFGLPKDHNYTLSEEQLSTRRLTTAQVKKHYEDYYHPANMRLFVAGHFDREAVMKLIEEKWASLPSRDGKVLDPLPKPKPRLAPYLRRTFTSETPYVYIGTKTWDVSIEEAEVLSSYVEFLSHRLMKEIRNLKGETYTASSHIENSYGFGYAYVNFQTQRDHLKENIDLVKQKIHDEAEMGNLTAEQVSEAVKLYFNDYFRRGKEADDMMQVASSYARFKSVYGKFESPFELIKNITPEKYNATLKKFFSRDRRYEYYYEPYYFFHYDLYVLYFLVMVTSFFAMRKLMTKSFHNDKVQWIRKIQFPPLKILEGIVLLAGLFLSMHIEYVLDEVFRTNLMQSNILLSEYLEGIFSTIGLLLCAQGVFSLLPRKLMVMDNKLIIKSATYYSRHIPMDQVASVAKMKFMSFQFVKEFFKANLKFRFYFYNPLFWSSGILIKLKGGQSLFFSVTSAQQAKEELDRLMAGSEAKIRAVA